MLPGCCAWLLGCSGWSVADSGFSLAVVAESLMCTGSDILHLSTLFPYSPASSFSLSLSLSISFYRSIYLQRPKTTFDSWKRIGSN